MASRRSVVVHVMWATAGLAVGATAALLWMGGFNAEWVEATGTWFGAVATVLTLLWAVQTFRADQTHRENERLRIDEDERERAALEVAAKQEADRVAGALVVAEASRMVITLLGGGGQGDRESQVMTSVLVDLANDTSRAVIVEQFALDAPLQPKSLPAFPIRVPTNNVQRVAIEIEHVEADAGELSGVISDRFTATMTYRVDGRTWTRSSDQAEPPALITPERQ